MRNWAMLIGTLGIGCMVGCGDSMVPVTGKVTLSTGAPLAGGRIEFRLDGEKPITARSYVADDGSYTLGVKTPGGGVPVGKYKVLVAAPMPKVDRDKVRVVPPSINPKYNSYETSGLQYEVTSGKDNVFDVVVEPVQ